MSIPFTQYLRPNGEQKPVDIDRSPEVEALARAFIDAGGYFEVETLRTGQVSLTAGHEDDDLAIELVENGPGVGEAVDRLVRLAFAAIPSLDREEVSCLDLEDQFEVYLGLGSSTPPGSDR